MDRKNAIAFSIIVFAAACFGTLGIITVLVIEAGVSISLFAFYGYTLVMVLIMVYCCIYEQHSLKECFDLTLGRIGNRNRKELKQLTILCTITRGSHVLLFIGFLLTSNKVLGAVIFELYPIVTIFASYKIFKGIYKEEEKASLFSWIFLAMGVCGIVLLSSEEITTVSVDEVFKSVIGICFFIGGAIFTGLASVSGAKMTYLMQKNYKLAYGSKRKIHKVRVAFLVSMMNQLVTGILLLPILFIISVFFNDFDDYISFFDNGEVIMLLLGYALLANLAQRTLAGIGGSMTTNRFNNMAWFFAPIVSISLLWLYGYGEISPVMGLGMVLIFVPNLILNVKVERSVSYNYTLVYLIIIAIVIFYTKGGGINHYFDIITETIVIFTLIIGFLIARIFGIYKREEELFFGILSSIKGSNKKLVDSLSAFYSKKNNFKLKENYKKIKTLGAGKIDEEKLDLLYVSSLKGISIAEIYILTMLAFFTTFILIVGRNMGFIFDLMALIISTSMVYLLLLIRDMILDRRAPIISYNKTAKNRYEVIYEPKKASDLVVMAIGFAIFLVIIISISLVFLLKWDFQFYQQL